MRIVYRRTFATTWTIGNYDGKLLTKIFIDNNNCNLLTNLFYETCFEMLDKFNKI